MANTIVKDITDAGKSLIASTLPTYTQIDYETFLEQNNFATRPKRYGFVSLDGVFVEGGLLGTITVNHRFQLILSTDYQNQDDDTKLIEAKNELWDASHIVLTEMLMKKVGLPSKVFLVSGLSLEEPEYIEDNIIVIRTNLNVQYRYKKG